MPDPDVLPQPPNFTEQLATRIAELLARDWKRFFEFTDDIINLIEQLQAVDIMEVRRQLNGQHVIDLVGEFARRIKKFCTEPMLKWLHENAFNRDDDADDDTVYFDGFKAHFEMLTDNLENLINLEFKFLPYVKEMRYGFFFSHAFIIYNGLNNPTFKASYAKKLPVDEFKERYNRLLNSASPPLLDYLLFSLNCYVVFFEKMNHRHIKPNEADWLKQVTLSAVEFLYSRAPYEWWFTEHYIIINRIANEPIATEDEHRNKSSENPLKETIPYTNFLKILSSLVNFHFEQEQRDQTKQIAGVVELVNWLDGLQLFQVFPRVLFMIRHRFKKHEEAPFINAAHAIEAKAEHITPNEPALEKMLSEMSNPDTEPPPLADLLFELEWLLRHTIDPSASLSNLHISALAFAIAVLTNRPYKGLQSQANYRLFFHLINTWVRCLEGLELSPNVQEATDYSATQFTQKLRKVGCRRGDFGRQLEECLANLDRVGKTDDALERTEASAAAAGPSGSSSAPNAATLTWDSDDDLFGADSKAAAKTEKKTKKPKNQKTKKPKKPKKTS